MLNFKLQYHKDAWGMGKHGIILYADDDGKSFHNNRSWEINREDINSICVHVENGINELMKEYYSENIHHKQLHNSSNR